MFISILLFLFLYKGWLGFQDGDNEQMVKPWVNTDTAKFIGLAVQLAGGRIRCFGGAV